MRVRAFGLLIAPWLLLCSSGLSQAFKETVLMTIEDPDYIPDTIAVDPETGRVAFARHSGCCFEQIVVNESMGPQYDRITKVGFSEHGGALSYLAAAGDLVRVVVNQWEGPAYVRAYNWRFSPDGKFLTYVGDRLSAGDAIPTVNVVDTRTGARREYRQAIIAKLSAENKRIANGVYDGSRQRIILDGAEGPAFDEIGVQDDRMLGYARQPIFSADGAHIAYIARNGRDRFVVVDGHKGLSFDDILWYTLRFSSSGEHFAFVGVRNNKQILVVDGRESDGYDEIVIPEGDGVFYRIPAIMAARSQLEWHLTGSNSQCGAYREVDSITVSGDGRRFGMIGKQGNRTVVCVDGTPLTSLPNIAFFKFSGDCKHFAYRACSSQKCLVVRDGRQGKTYDQIYGMYINGDATILAYDAREKKISFVVVNEKEDRGHVPVSLVDLTPDGREVFYVARNGAGVTLVRGANEIGRFHEIAPLSISWSPSGRRVAYVAIDESDRQFLVVDGKSAKPYRALLRSEALVWMRVPAFSSDETHVAYIAEGDDFQTIVVDACESREFERVLQVTPVQRDVSDSQLLYAYRGNKVFSVRVSLQSTGNRTSSGGCVPNP